MAKKEVLTTWDAARYCNVNPYTVRRWVVTGQLRAYTTPGGHRRILRKDLDSFLKAHGMPMPQDFREGKRRVLTLLPPKLAGLASRLEALSPDLEVSLTHLPFEAGLALASRPPDLFLLDLDHPGWDGVAACRSVRDNPATSAVRVAALTSKATVETFEALQLAGVLVIFSKPPDPAEMLRFLRDQFPSCRWVARKKKLKK